MANTDKPAMTLTQAINIAAAMSYHGIAHDITTPKGRQHLDIAINEIARLRELTT